MEKKTKNKRFLKSGKRATKSMVKGDKKRVKAKVAKHVQHTPKAVKTRDRLAQLRHSATKKVQIKQKTVQKNAEKPVQKREGKVNKYIPSPKETKEALNILFANDFAVDYLKKNVNKSALDVLSLLQSPNTDEAIAMQLDMKVNSVRRILNIMQGYGITNYYVAKNTNGWLSFAWYVNTGKISSFFDYIKSMKGDEYSVIKEDCNDYFVCKKCYKDDSIIFTFDAAYEAGFKCGSCGEKFDMISKEEAMELINQDRQKQEAALLSLRASAENQSINMALPQPQQKKQFK
jgi:transcription initiation factor IIE alpha subunit